MESNPAVPSTTREPLPESKAKLVACQNESAPMLERHLGDEDANAVTLCDLNQQVLKGTNR